MKRVTLLFALMSVFLTNAQERVNLQNSQFLKSSNVLKEATGWGYNKESGQWIENKNFIDEKKNYKNNPLDGPYMMSQNENFSTLQFKSFIYNNATYYLLLLKKWDGSYDYPSIQRGWKESQRLEGYVFSESEYQKLTTITGPTEMKTKIFLREYSFDNETGESDLLLKIIGKMKSDEEADKKKTKSDRKYDEKFGSVYTFAFTKSNEGAIRFRIPQNFYKHTVEYNTRYFETTPEVFSALLVN